MQLPHAVHQRGKHARLSALSFAGRILSRLQCLRVAEKSKSAKDCERDLTNKAQVTARLMIAYCSFFL
jgi:hypothetical protein